MKTSKIDLCGDWQFAVLSHGEHKDYISAKELLCDGVEIMPATVPGTVELDLEKAGKIKDLFFGRNPDKIRRYTERLHCYYFKTFTADRISNAPRLVFEGLDCYADIYVNGNLAANVDNMLIEHTVDISNTIRLGENEIFVHIKPTIIEAQKYEYPFMVTAGKSAYEQLYVRKPAHMFGWDSMPRYLSAGLWRPVSLQYTEQEEGIEEYYLCTAKADEQQAIFELFYKTKCDIVGDVRIRLEGKCNESVFKEEFKIIFPYGRRKLVFNNPLLWWPNNFGKPHRYDWKISLLKDGEVIESISFKQGIASIKLDYDPILNLKNNEGKFNFVVNGQPIFIKGINWVGSYPFHSEDVKRIPRALELAEQLNINMIRCWGGNVYENDLFYELCEEKGIMVWQDFAFACGKHPIDSEFCARVREEATQVVKRLRHFACLALWSGDNEGDFRWNVWESISMDPNIGNITRTVLPEVVMQHDSARTYLPSSPYLSPEYVNRKAGEGKTLLEDHFYFYWGDIYYKQERHSRFASECGSMCLPSPESMEKYISPDKLFTGTKFNDEWVMHCTQAIPELEEGIFRTETIQKLIELLFEDDVKSLSDYVIKSQIVSTESVKYAFEQYRSQKWEKTGMLLWVLMDMWPQSSEALIDHYYDEKLSYYGIQTCYSNVCLMMRDSFDKKYHPLIAANDTLNDVNICYKVTDCFTNIVLASGAAKIEANSNKQLAIIPESQETRYIIIEWKGDCEGKNHYLDFTRGKKKINVKDYFEFLENTGLYQKWLSKAKRWMKKY